MDDSKSNLQKDLGLNHEKKKELHTLLMKLKNLSHSERKVYFVSIPKQELILISEIVLNFLNDRFHVPAFKFKLLKRIKNSIRKLADKKVSLKNKRIILSSIKGLQIINILLPIVLEILL